MEIKIFEKQEFGYIRTFTDNGGKLWFCGSDVAKGLGYSNPRDAVGRHCRCVAKHDVPHPQATDKNIEMAFISEGDVYRLITHSKLPSAERFESWVFDEILPSIRKTGGYNADATMQSVVQTLATMQRVLEAQQEINKKLLSQLQTPPTVSDEPEQLAFTEHLPYPPLNQKRGQSKRVGRRPVRWFNIRLYNSLYNAYPKPLRELEKDVGVCGVTLRAWRNGENRPNINNARKLAAVLGVDEEDLFLE